MQERCSFFSRHHVIRLFNGAAASPAEPGQGHSVGGDSL